MLHIWVILNLEFPLAPKAGAHLLLGAWLKSSAMPGNVAIGGFGQLWLICLFRLCFFLSAFPRDCGLRGIHKIPFHSYSFGQFLVPFLYKTRPPVRMLYPTVPRQFYLPVHSLRWLGSSELLHKAGDRFGPGTKPSREIV